MEGANMPVTVKSITLWRKELENHTGTLAETLEPLARAGADLQVVMGYRHGEQGGKAAVEVYPLTGKKSIAGARAAGLTASSIPTLLVEGDNKAGLGYAVAQAIADAGINMAFLVAQVTGRKYSCVIGFENEGDAKTATALIKKATLGKKK
jgi:hypothetical protein